MSWRPPSWENPDWGFSLFSGSNYERGKERYIAYEAGADAMLEELLPLLRQVYAQLCGVRLKCGKEDYYSALDESIDKLKPMVMEDK